MSSNSSFTERAGARSKADYFGEQLASSQTLFEPRSGALQRFSPSGAVGSALRHANDRSREKAGIISGP